MQNVECHENWIWIFLMQLIFFDVFEFLSNLFVCFPFKNQDRFCLFLTAHLLRPKFQFYSLLNPSQGFFVASSFWCWLQQICAPWVPLGLKQNFSERCHPLGSNGSESDRILGFKHEIVGHRRVWLQSCGEGCTKCDWPGYFQSTVPL